MRRTRILLPGILLAAPYAIALNPALDISQYAHKAWKNSDGFAKGPIHSIAQTPDGYLWLGTEFGLLRFDGARGTAWPHQRDLPSSKINKLLTARNGTLWIGTSKGLASWIGGKLTQYPELAGQTIFTLFEDREGAIWAGSASAPTARLCVIQKGTAQCYGEDGRFESTVLSLYEYKGYLWVGANTGLWRWKPDPPKLYPVPGAAASIPDLIEGDNGALLISTTWEIRQLVDGKAKPYTLHAGGQFPRRLLRDRDGGLWIGTSEHGLLHVHQGRTDLFAASDGLSGDNVSSLFEDREGNIWAGTNDGLDCFRELAVSTISVKQGMSGGVSAVLAYHDGSIWLGSNGLHRWKDGTITIYRKGSARPATMGVDQPQRVREVSDDGLPDNAPESLFEDGRGRIWVSTPRGVAYFENGRFIPVATVPSTMVHSIAEGSAGDLWINDQKLGLLHLHGGRLIEQFAWSKLGRNDAGTDMAADERQGGLWLGFLRGGMAYFKEGQILASYEGADGLGEGRVNQLRLDRDRTLWAATEGGLSRLKDRRIATLTSNNGLPCDAVHWSIEDNAGSFWLNMPCGLVRIARPELNAWVADFHRKIQATVLDSSDGVKSLAMAGGFTPNVAKDRDGRLWFVNYPGVGVIDPLQLPFNKLPPPVHIEQITADRKSYDANAGVHLPPLVRDLQIDYTALSLVAPEKVCFRYKLEGHDSDWQDAGTRRQAFYNDLPPRHYRFRVIACNNSGVWNEAGASFDFSIEPAYYQTTWFLVSCGAAVLALLAGLYQLRLRQIAWQFNIRVEERVNERTRIARDFHDTLLQSFQGVLMKFSAVTYMLSDRPEAREKLETVIEQARQAITEGRDAVQGLRSSTVVTNDLVSAITMLGEELAAEQTGQNCPKFLVRVEGASRDLAPLVRDDVHRIACEAVRNAFRHAQASRIEVEIHYDRRQLRLQVVDNGKGIDQPLAGEGGRPGHFGLPGMQERAKLVGGEQALLSRRDSGTEVELTIPAALAYTKSPVIAKPMCLGKGT